MESLMKSEVFFFVATIALVVVAALLSVAIVYLVKFLKKANRISDSVENGLEEMEERLKDQPWFHFLFKKRSKARKQTKDKNTKEE
ncbi:MAG: hypothetical protein KBB70_00230 [Candidatus Pacebacteria bacterium]|nr:hypothetical protein [Candidatus Paceibacterota bacterium]